MARYSDIVLLAQKEAYDRFCSAWADKHYVPSPKVSELRSEEDGLYYCCTWKFVVYNNTVFGTNMGAVMSELDALGSDNDMGYKLLVIYDDGYEYITGNDDELFCEWDIEPSFGMPGGISLCDIFE